MLKRHWSVLATLCLVTGVLVGTPSTAVATSGYDNLIHVMPKLEVYTDGPTKSQKLDISKTWWTDLQQTYQRRLQYHNWNTMFIPAFQHVLDSGGSWGILSQENAGGNVLTLYGTDDPNATCDFREIPDTGMEWFVCSTTSAGHSLVRTDYFAHSSYGNNGCGYYGVNTCSDNGMNIYSEPAVYSNLPIGRILAIPVTSLSSYKFYAWNFGMTYPEGYDGEILPSTRVTNTGATYVAMGDSYSSGEGNPPYEAHTNTTGVDQCHRSEQAYPRMLASDSSLNLGELAFVACSGATTDTVLNGGSGSGAWSEGSQVNALSSSTQVVTLTIGGNDMGFSEVLGACARRVGIGAVLNEGWGCKDNGYTANALTDRLAALNGTAAVTQYEPENDREIHSISEVIEEIAAVAPNARILVAGYPQLFGSDVTNFDANTPAPGGATCSIGTGVNVSYADAQWLNDWADSLDGAIEGAAQDTAALGINVDYVDPVGFNGHGYCDANDAYLNSVYVDEANNPSPESAHPNNSGVIYGYQIPFAANLD